MDEPEEMKPEPVKYTKARLICGEVEALKDEVLVRPKPTPYGDWAMLASME